MRPAKAAPIDQDFSGDFDSPIDLIHSTVSPTTWDEVGGPGSIAPDRSHLALIVSQTEDVHEGVSALLTLLRRSRYAAFHKEHPWELARGIGDGASTTPLLDMAAGAEPAFAPRQAWSRGRRTGCAGRAGRAARAGRWRLAMAAERRPRQCRRDARGAEVRPAAGFQLPQRVLRTEGEAAAIAYPGLALVELGNFGPSVRQAADAWLPWLPHRSNEELARCFEVSPIDAKEQPAGADSVQLRLVPAGLSDTAGTYLKVSFDRRSGLPESWESYFQDRLTGRLRFADRVERGPAAGWASVVLEDPAGKVLTRWMLIDSPPATGPIPALSEDWPGSVLLDRRAAEAAVDRPLEAALEAMRKAEWATAARALEALAAAHLGQPLVAVLRGYCYQHCPGRGDRAQILAGLRAAAATGKGPLVRFIAQENLPWLQPAERYEILAAQPAATRNTADCDELARAAMAAGRLGGCPGARPGCAGHERPRRPGAAAAVPAGGTLVAAGPPGRCRQGRPRWHAGGAAGRPGAATLAAGIRRVGRIAGQARPPSGGRRVVRQGAGGR